MCLIGANGAGKTTTLRAITGLAHAGGRIVYDGEDIAGAQAPRDRAQGHRPRARGPRRLPAAHHRGEPRDGRLHAQATAPAIAADVERVFALFPRLKERRRQTAGTMSGGEQQMLAIGRALMSRPRLLLLDEPSMGLAPLMVERIFEVIRLIAAEGVTMLLVEQNARLALEASRRAYVLESGLVTLSGRGRRPAARPAGPAGLPRGMRRAREAFAATLVTAA